MGAIGAVMYAHSNELQMGQFAGLASLEKYLEDNSSVFSNLPQLKESEATYNKDGEVQKERHGKNTRIPGNRCRLAQHQRRTDRP